MQRVRSLLQRGGLVKQRVVSARRALEEEFLLHRPHVGGRALRKAPGHSLESEVPEVRGWRFAAGHQFLRIFVTQLIEREAAAFCYFYCFFN